MDQNIRGFTLLEFLVIFGILLFIGSIIYVINPRELLAEWRDSRRMADLNKLETALSDYLATASGQRFDFDCANKCYASFDGAEESCGSRYFRKSVSDQAGRGIDGSGWLPADFTGDAEKSFALLPVDPKNNSEHFYSFACDNTTRTFELNAKMESLRYSQGGKDDVESADGGDNPRLYEIGTKPGLSL